MKFKKNTFVLVDQICFFQHKVNKNQKMSDNFCGLNNPKLGNCEVFLVHLLHEFGCLGLGLLGLGELGERRGKIREGSRV